MENVHITCNSQFSTIHLRAIKQFVTIYTVNKQYIHQTHSPIVILESFWKFEIF